MDSKIENVAIVYLNLPNNDENDLIELKNLVESAQGKVALTIEQKRNAPDPNTIVGSGKLNEIKDYIELHNSSTDDKINVVVFSEQLNSTQRAVLEKNLDCSVIDRVDLILDIFALRAKSAEGKKQVELAQLSYNLATKPEKSYSRQGAGIGTRGPGETQLETNKRVIREKIYRLKAELNEIEKHREITRKKRKENDIFTIALVGYTNAGKSTLFNRLSSDNVYADNLLFATLDTTVRKIQFNDQEALICDTVGFINNLPHQLIEAFKSTLEEAINADLILEVLDVSDNNVENQRIITENLLEDLNITAPIIRVYNKCDAKFCSDILFNDNKKSIFISALNGTNIDLLLEESFAYSSDKIAKIKLKVPYKDLGTTLSLLNQYGASLSTNYLDDNVYLQVKIKRKYVDNFLKYIYIE